MCLYILYGTISRLLKVQSIERGRAACGRKIETAIVGTVNWCDKYIVFKKYIYISSPEELL